MANEPLTPQQIKARAALIDHFRIRIVAAIWEGIEYAPPELLAADDGTRYGEMVQSSLGVSALDQMVNEVARAACKRMSDWL